jgi:1-pyrroline-5-carboxylate dehydrogenase
VANAQFNLPLPPNEPLKSYAPGSPERISLKAKLKELRSQQIEIPLIIGGKEVRTGKKGKCILPHAHKTVIGEYHQAGEKEVKMAIDALVRQGSRFYESGRSALYLMAGYFQCCHHAYPE